VSDEPALTTTGRTLLVAALGVLLVAATSGTPALFGIAAVALGMLGGAWFDARALRRDAEALSLEIEARDGGARARGAPLPVGLVLLHAGARGLRDVTVTLRVAGEPSPAPRIRVDVPAGARGEVVFPLRFPHAGHWRIHGAVVRLESWLGLAACERYVPDEHTLVVRPRRLPPLVADPLLSRRGAWRDRAGRHINRQAGSGLELRELRDYVPGDALKTVAWMATARRQRPLVRAFEEESVRRVQLLLDMGPTMRAGAPGATPLDAAVDLCASLAERGVHDRVGLTSFDHRVYGHLKPASGRAHLQRQLHHLMDLTRVVDDDLTETTDAELLARIGAFLEAQESLPLRRVGDAPWRPAVARTLIDPLAELYDEGALYQAVTRYLAHERDRGHAALFAKSRPAKETRSARLRLFCALRGLPLAYRLTGPTDARETGLRDAIGRNLMPGGPERLLVFSDLRGLRPDGEGIRALRLASARKKQVVLVPLGAPAPAPVLRALRAARVQLQTLPDFSSIAS